MGGFWSIEPSKMASMPIVRNLCLPFTVSFMPRNPSKTALIAGVFILIVLVFKRCRFAQIFEAIVIADTVNMVQFFNWPHAVSDSPDQTMNQNGAASSVDNNGDLTVAGSMVHAGWFPGTSRIKAALSALISEVVKRPLSPPYLPGLEISIEYFSQERDRNISVFGSRHPATLEGER